MKNNLEESLLGTVEKEPCVEKVWRVSLLISASENPTLSFFFIFYAD